MVNTTAYIWAFIGRIGPLVIQFVTMMLLARVLTPNDFGQIGVLSVFLMVANTLNDAGFGGALIKEKKISIIDCSTVFIYNSSISIIIYIILFISSNYIEGYFKSSGLSFIIKIISLVFVINSFGMVAKAILTRELKFKIITCINIIGIIIASIVSVILAFNNFGVNALIAFQLVQAIVITIGVITFSHLHISIKFSIDSFKRLFSFGIFTTCCNIIDTIYENLLTFLFGKYLSITQAGYISQAKRIEEVATTSVAQTINTASFPLLTRLKEKQTFLKESYSLLKFIPATLFPILLLIPLYAHEIVLFVLGKQWLSATTYLSILVIAGMFMIIETIIRNFIKALGEVSALLKITIIKRLIGLIIIICILFTYRSLILWGYVLGAAIGLIMNVYLFTRILSINYFSCIRILIRSTLPSIFFYIANYILFSLIPILYLKISISFILLIITYLCTFKFLHINFKSVLNTIR